MITLQELQDSTMPVAVPVGPEKNLVLHVFNQKGTPEHKKRLSTLLNESANIQQTNQEKFLKLQSQRLKVQAEVLELSEKRDTLLADLQKQEADSSRIAELRTQIAAMDKDIESKGHSIEKPLAELSKQIDDVAMQGEMSLHESYARQLEFFVSSMEIEDADGKQIPPSFEFFRDKFAFNLLQQSVMAIAKALDGFLVQGSTGA